MKRTLTREVCKRCWRESAVGFAVPNAVWREVAWFEYRDKALCVGCFTLLADQRGVEWDKDIEFFPVSLVTFNRE